MREDLELPEGAIDMHAHPEPALLPPPYDHAQVAKAALQFGMWGFS